jgi:phosphate transport system ATP-binding protein
MTDSTKTPPKAAKSPSKPKEVEPVVVEPRVLPARAAVPPVAAPPVAVYVPPATPRLSKGAMRMLEKLQASAAQPLPAPARLEAPRADTAPLLKRLRSAVRIGRGFVRDRMPLGQRLTQVTDMTPTEAVTPAAGIEIFFPPAVEPAPAPLAELNAIDISAWFGDHQVLDRVSLTMPAGVITSLIGPSGCGKSTFLRILNRMHELIPSASLAGEVMLDGVDIYDAERRLVDARKSIGMVFQKPNPFPAMSIYDNVIAGLKLTGIRADRDRRDYLVESSLTKAGLWKEVRDRLRAPGGGLSGGQQQRLCIARSLAVAPRVLLMDEPCSALDPTSTRVIEETMLELAQEVTIVIVTHNMQQAQRVSTQCAFFLAAQGKPGGIVEHGSTEAMFSDPIDPRTHDYVNGVFG